MPSHPDSRKHIPQFSLYGESARNNLIDFVHIEKIHVRSSKNDWIIKPHRHNTLFQILCIRRGSTTVFLDDTTVRAQGSHIITVPVGVVHGFNFLPQTEGYVLSLAIKQQGLDTESQIGSLFSEDMLQAHVLELDHQPEEKDFLWPCLDEIAKELEENRRDQSLALFSLVKTVLVNIRRKALKAGSHPLPVNQHLQLNEKFRKLVEEKFSEHWNIARYASELHTSASTLNRSCLEYLGLSAKKYLQERIHTESKRLLIYTTESQDAIAYKLGFKDAAYFSRVFRNIENCSPRDFRKKMQERIELITSQPL